MSHTHEAKLLTEHQGAGRVGRIMHCLTGLHLFDALSALVVSMFEVIDHVEDKNAAWDAVLKSIELGRKQETE